MTSSRWAYLVVEAAHPQKLAWFWAAVLDYQVLYEQPAEVVIGASCHSYPGLCFIQAATGHAGASRLHIDLDPNDHDAEVERIIALGARPVDRGDNDLTSTVLADPEGNRFCVLRPLRSLVD